MFPVEPPYVPILLNETFTKALWDTGAEKSFLSEEVYKKSEETQDAFDAIKKAITEAPVLILPNFKSSFELLTDAISIGVEAVLNQEQKPEAFASRTINSAERNYTERDCLAVIRALNKF
ncbi:hypothetical protein TNCV_5132071 [Trichonephila clavipes]|nr:hypothetical protein TNCV_5132071 [Trichonephila clavipes]